MESSFGTQHPINAGTRGMDRARSSRWKKSLEQDGNYGWKVGGDEKQDLFEGVENEVTERTKKLFGKMKGGAGKVGGLGTTSTRSSHKKYTAWLSTWYLKRISFDKLKGLRKCSTIYPE